MNRPVDLSCCGQLGWDYSTLRLTCKGCGRVVAEADQPVAPADAHGTPLPGASAPFVRIVMEDGKAYPIPAAVPLRSTAGVVNDAPANLAAPATLNDGYGTKPRCLTCGRGQAGCICNMPDPEPEYFKPGLNRDPDAGWALAERSALR